MVDVVVEKQVNALNKSFINFFKQGITPCHGIGSSNARTTLVCHICTPSDRVVTICPRIGYLKFKFRKCDFPHNIKNCDFKTWLLHWHGLVLENREGTQTKLCCKQLLGGTY